MTEQHECVWDINFVRGYAFCAVPLCEARLDGDEVATRLNEYETLKKRLNVIYASIDDYLAPVTVKGTTKDEYVSVEASTLAWWMDAIEDILEDK